MNPTGKIDHELSAECSPGSAGTVFEFGFEGKGESDLYRVAGLIHDPPSITSLTSCAAVDKIHFKVETPTGNHGDGGTGQDLRRGGCPSLFF